MLGSPTTIVNNTFVENWVGTGAFSETGDKWANITPAAYGGAIQVKGSTSPVSVVNNIFYDNMALYGNSVACTEYGEADVSYCDAWPGTSGDNYATDTGGVCNLGIRVIYLNPLFANISNGSYWLDINSLLLQDPNHGQSRTYNNNVPEFDITGHERPGDLYTDMGAYESDPGNYP
ncbi:MAG: hypothetical protein NT018_13800 [Armatimonadetes bacterium]|nr:hypothetical protein [Armatimonadota bacterium]